MQLKFIITAAISAMLLACGCQKPAAITEQPATNPENPPPKPPAVRTDGCCVIYVIDRSGSMVDVFDMVKYEMRKSIALLNEDQYFHVIFFSEGQPIETKPRGLVPATDNNKLRCGRWLDEIVPCGQTDPIPALERAFDVLSHADSPKGKLIYLLTDGAFPDNEKVLELIRSKNSDRSIRICTFLYSEDREEEAVRVLMLIAEENGGTFCWVNPEE